MNKPAFLPCPTSHLPETTCDTCGKTAALNIKISELVNDSADDYGVTDPGAERLAAALTAVLDFVDEIDAASGAGACLRELTEGIRERVSQGLNGTSADETGPHRTSSWP